MKETTMRTTKIVMLWLVLGSVGAASAVGCASATSESPPATVESAATKAPVAKQAHGPVRFLGDALSDVPLRAEQRAEIETLASDAEARHAEAQGTKRDIADLVAAQVERGTIDRDAFAPKIEAAVVAIDKTRPLDRAAFERLHAVLDHEQRVALVDAIEVRLRAHKERAGRGHLEEWVTDLKLAPVQFELIRTTVMKQLTDPREEGAPERGRASWREGREKGQRVLAAFKEDRFVLDEVAPPTDARAMAKAMSGKILDVVDVVLPALTPEQRTLAAAKIRAHAASDEAGL
jgi:Spy/CpxP family protein refolding chaperone